MSTRTTLRRSRTGAALLVAVPLVAAAAHFTAASTADAAPAAASATANAQVQHAIDSGSTAVRRLVDDSAHDYALATAILEKATVSTITTDAGRSAAPASADAAESCHGPVTSKTTVRIAGIDLGWRKAIVNQWCWNSSKITSWSLDHDEWSGFGYCWKEEAQTNTWLVHPTRLNYRNKGTLTGVAPWGCSGGQQTISPSVHYERGGGYNVYADG